MKSYGVSWKDAQNQNKNRHHPFFLHLFYKRTFMNKYVSDFYTSWQACIHLPHTTSDT